MVADRARQWSVSALAREFGLTAQALRFYEAENVDYRLREAICRLWGMTFSAEETSNASTLLGKTLNQLEGLYQTITGLQQSGLYLLVSRQAQVTGALHMTNILGHDQHYRHLAIHKDQIIFFLTMH